MAERVGLVGLGTMGFPMALNLISAGFDPLVYDRSPDRLQEAQKRGARVARSVADLAEHVDVVEIAVAPQSEVEAVTIGPDGLLSAARLGSVLDIHSTALPSAIQRIAEVARSHGVAVLDAQMSGGDQGMIARTLCFMVGGDAEVLERCRPIMNASGTSIFHLGGLGAGAIAKIAQNTILATTLVAASEGFAVAREAGLDLEVFQDAIRASAAQSHVADAWLHHWAVRVSPDAYQWILESALSFGGDHGLDLPASALTKQILPRILGPKGSA